MIVGITGPSGAGKSFLSSLLAERDFVVLDCDKIYHELISHPGDCVSELHECFGSSVVTADGGIDRNALGHIVFSDPIALSKLNTITHKFVIGEIEKLIFSLRRSNKSVVIDAPTLFEAGGEKLCDLTVGVLAPRQTRAERLCDRDGAFKTSEQLDARINASKPDLFYKQRCDIIWVNDTNGESASEFADRIVALRDQNFANSTKLQQPSCATAKDRSEFFT